MASGTSSDQSYTSAARAFPNSYSEIPASPGRARHGDAYYVGGLFLGRLGDGREIVDPFLYVGADKENGCIPAR